MDEGEGPFGLPEVVNEIWRRQNVEFADAISRLIIASARTLPICADDDDAAMYVTASRLISNIASIVASAVVKSTDSDIDAMAMLDHIHDQTLNLMHDLHRDIQDAKQKREAAQPDGNGGARPGSRETPWRPAERRT